ncbi:hypothetical protein, partial [Zavarzinia sp.]|uniref:hypothetical protein n=1 Tax=Zavarzinia sp. TaxID=2027920 RepID=UPI003BB611FA
MMHHHDELERQYHAARDRLWNGETGVWPKVFDHFAVPDPKAGRPAVIAFGLAYLMLQRLALGAGRVLTRRDGSFQFARGEGGEGALLLFIMDWGGDLYVIPPMLTLFNRAARNLRAMVADPGDAARAGDGPMPYLDLDPHQAALLEVGPYDFIDCLAWTLKNPARVYRCNSLVDALWQYDRPDGADDPLGTDALDLWTCPRDWIAAWLRDNETVEAREAAKSADLPAGGTGPMARASLVVDGGAIDWTRWGRGPLTGGALDVRVRDN